MKRFKVVTTYSNRRGLLFAVVDGDLNVDEAFRGRSLAEAWAALQNERAAEAAGGGG